MSDDQIIRDAQYRKGLSIAFFNATNNAAQLIELESKVNPVVIGDIKERIIFWRDWLLEEHKNYYAEVIANIGVYDSKESMKKLNTVTNLEELKTVWMSFSEDERRDGEIIELKNTLKETYEK